MPAAKTLCLALGQPSQSSLTQCQPLHCDTIGAIMEIGALFFKYFKGKLLLITLKTYLIQIGQYIHDGYQDYWICVS